MAQATQRARVFVSACLALFTTAAAAHASEILYQQVPDFPAPSSARTSYGAPSDPFFRTFDNFELTQTALVTEVTWQGSYNDFVNPSNNPADPNTISFELVFWSDAAGEPGIALLSQTLPIANVSATFVGLTSPSSFNVFNYVTDLPIPFLAQSGTPFWLSIFSNSSSFTPLWGWRTGSGGDGMSFQENLATGAEGAVNFDRAFSLSGQNAVPEPGSLVLTTLGLAAAMLRGRRRLRRPVPPLRGRASSSSSSPSSIP